MIQLILCPDGTLALSVVYASVLPWVWTSAIDALVRAFISNKELCLKLHRAVIPTPFNYNQCIITLG